jgi:hypothetical protein
MFAASAIPGDVLESFKNNVLVSACEVEWIGTFLAIF